MKDKEERKDQQEGKKGKEGACIDPGLKRRKVTDPGSSRYFG